MSIPLEEFTAHFWAEKVRWCEAGDVTPDGQLAVRTPDGCHYVIGREMPKGYQGFLGFGGAPWEVTFTSGPHAGRVVKTTNLWCQSMIPDEFRDRLPTNATLQSTMPKPRFQGFNPVGLHRGAR